MVFSKKLPVATVALGGIASVLVMRRGKSDLS